MLTAGFEPATLEVETLCSVQLSYASLFTGELFFDLINLVTDQILTFA